jgi:hypothetical protein
VPVSALLGELLLHHVLGGDAGVVHARDPHGVLPRIRSRRIIASWIACCQRVPDVQRTGDVRRRDDDRERLAVVVGLGVEQPGGLPVPYRSGSTAAGS